MKEKEKHEEGVNSRNYYKTALWVVSIVFIIGVSSYLFIAYSPQYIDIGNGGGGGTPPPPPPPPPIPPPPELVPNAPTLQAIVPNPDPDGSIYLKWNVMTGAIGYKVYMSKNNGAWQLISTTGAIATVKNGLGNGAYRFRVQAYNSIGFSPYSNIRSITVSIPPPPPPPPIPPPPPQVLEAPVLNNIAPNPSNDGYIQLSWSSVSNVGYYEIYGSKDGDSYQTITTKTLTAYKYTVIDDGTYSYKIKAISNTESFSDSGFSNVQSVVVSTYILPTPPLPDTPILYNIVPKPSVDGKVSLEWGDISNVIEYEVFRSKDGGSFGLLETLDGYKTSYNDLVLYNGVYSYKIRARNDAGYSEFSNVEFITVSVSVEDAGELPEVISTDYTMIYVLLGIFGVLFGAVIILTIKKKKRS